MICLHDPYVSIPQARKNHIEHVRGVELLHQVEHLLQVLEVAVGNRRDVLAAEDTHFKRLRLGIARRERVELVPSRPRRRI